MIKILVTGATGHLGRAVINHLLDKTSAENLAVLVRNPAKAEDLKAQGVRVSVGDYNDYASLVTAFRGVDKLYFVSGNDIPKRFIQHENVVRAAAEAKVGHLYYTSFQRRVEDHTSPIAFVAASHLATEKQIKHSGLTYTLLKHGLYTDMLPMFFGNQLFETGTIFMPAGDGKVSFATRDDMAAAGAVLLTHSGNDYDNKELEIAGNKTYSFKDIATMLGELTGTSFQYISPAPKDFIEQLTGAGVPSEITQMICAFSAAIEQGELDFPDATLEKIIGNEAVSVKDFLMKTYHLDR